jgi:methylenetetrahydrofolate dehydrogenase (NADP+)/methenyltetrahydrofolate cyclohydrolase
MPARPLDGAGLARQMREALQPQVQAFTARAGRPPGLALVLVGDDPASHVYVGSKRTHGTEVGFRVDLHQRPGTAALDEVLELVRSLNADEAIDGILVQSPLPSAMGSDAARRVFETIDPAKDVDGFTAENVGRLVQNRDGLVACTPAGIIELIEHEQVPIAGRRAVVIGRSDIVGKAIGRAGFVTTDFVKPGATVIDVGMNRVTAESDVVDFFGAGSKRHVTWQSKGSVLMGDVHPRVADVAGALTPVPGGVGPLTIAMLMKNTLTAASRRVG